MSDKCAHKHQANNAASLPGRRPLCFAQSLGRRRAGTAAVRMHNHHNLPALVELRQQHMIPDKVGIVAGRRLPVYTVGSDRGQRLGGNGIPSVAEALEEELKVSRGVPGAWDEGNCRLGHCYFIFIFLRSRFFGGERGG